jgi:hypothetical protein
MPDHIHCIPLGNQQYVYITAIFPATGGLLFGHDTGEIDALGRKERNDDEQFGKARRRETSRQRRSTTLACEPFSTEGPMR